MSSMRGANQGRDDIDVSKRRHRKNKSYVNRTDGGMKNKKSWSRKKYEKLKAPKVWTDSGEVHRNSTDEVLDRLAKTPMPKRKSVIGFPNEIDLAYQEGAAVGELRAITQAKEMLYHEFGLDKNSSLYDRWFK